VTELARGMIRISNTKIMGAVRAISIELGHDPKDFSLLSFGGGGGLVAVDVARELDIPEVIVPPGQGAFSALGMLMADVQHNLSRTCVEALDSLDPAQAEALFADMEHEAAGMLANEGFAPDAQTFHRSVNVRYLGQEHAVSVELPAELADPRTVIAEQFNELHERQYGHVMDDPIEITTLRLVAVGIVDKPALPKLATRAPGESYPSGIRTVVLPGDTTAEYTLVARESLLAGDIVNGPAVITEHTATTVLHAGDRLAVGEYGELNIRIQHSEKGA
jgi:N-methylhydantoinase A